MVAKLKMVVEVEVEVVVMVEGLEATVMVEAPEASVMVKKEQEAVEVGEVAKERVVEAEVEVKEVMAVREVVNLKVTVENLMEVGVIQ